MKIDEIPVRPEEAPPEEARERRLEGLRCRLEGGARGTCRAAMCIPVSIALMVLAGCGYELIGTHLKAPGGIRTVSVGEFQNRSREFGLDKQLAFAFEREFYQRGTLTVMEDPGGGEGVITGTIHQFKTRPVAFDKDDEALQYEAELTLDVVLLRQSDGAVLWRGLQLQAIEEYSVSPETVVPSSSQFQRGTLDFDDLEQLTDIQLAETEKRLAIERLVGSIVRDVHDRILDDF